jgi:hypothetical protein
MGFRRTIALKSLAVYCVDAMGVILLANILKPRSAPGANYVAPLLGLIISDKALSGYSACFDSFASPPIHALPVRLSVLVKWRTVLARYFAWLVAEVARKECFGRAAGSNKIVFPHWNFRKRLVNTLILEVPLAKLFIK